MSRRARVVAGLVLACLACTPTEAMSTSTHAPAPASERPRARDLGITIGPLEPGALDAITDVPGVRVGHVTRIEGEGIRTGATAILPHEGDLFAEKVPAAIVVGNGFGKLVGVTQVDELGQLETPIVLTNTLQVWDAAAAIVDWSLAQPGHQDIRSINPVVGETNDGWLSDIRARPLTRADFVRAIESAAAGPVEEGTVGAGTGTRALGYKGGIGTASRRVEAAGAPFTVGVLVQANFCGHLVVDGVSIGPDLADTDASVADHDGSCMIVVATDAPLDARRLRRLAARALVGMGRTGASMSHGSGDYVIAFSAAPSVRIPHRTEGLGEPVAFVPDAALTPLLVATADATEEAILHSEDTILGFSDGLNSVQNGDPQSEDKNDEGHDHPAHAPCGSCHGHAVGVSDLAIPTVGAVSLLFQRLFDAPLSSLIDGLFRPPRV